LVVENQKNGNDYNHGDKNVDGYDARRNNSQTAVRASGSFMTNPVTTLLAVFLIAHAD
jgi:hypothetical protein